jgi:RNA polymerase subunit RPABC4/transcription elongation factor Spt4
MVANVCISCGRTPVTWPRVCPDCTDQEAQAILASEGYEECKSCGMLYDGGMRCTYCGDPDPWDQGEDL